MVHIVPTFYVVHDVKSLLYIGMFN